MNHESCEDPCVGLALVSVRRRQKRCGRFVCHVFQRVVCPLAAMVDVTSDLRSRPGGGQAWEIAPVRMPGKRWRRGPRAEFAIEVIVEDFERVPRYAPRRRPSLNP